jgi:hypothetical protein
MKITPILGAALLALWAGAAGAKETPPAKTPAKAVAAVTNAPPAATNVFVELFNGHTLAGWQVVPFGGAGAVKILSNGALEIGAGEVLTGLVYTNKPVRMNYEIVLEARRTSGSVFFCGLTLPVYSNSCTLIIGGWGGSLTGISSIDDMDASENSTGDTQKFEQHQWYKICLRVTPEKIEAFLDNQRIVNLDIDDHRLGMRAGEIEACMPLGLATYQTRAELRRILLRKLPD